ncbi:cation diffusion facilitator family transporter [Mesonia sp. K7]|uniref:cation diffusion facilitator family transporter n=1 Tax=Mesonia sp. K7 TaxID=2218606 RepID=UPI000DAA3E07|nr:cation transporter [Mesonia sp. K7]PZD76710.1 cation transporter [Mesonia sp. K7]
MGNKKSPYELPDRLKPVLEKAKKLEWITIIYLSTVILLMYVVMGASQAMKTAWLEDALSLLPGISFLIATRIYDKAPNTKFPYGYHRVYSIAFLTGAVALFSIGMYLCIDSTLALVMKERPTIGSTVIFDKQIWMGWLMILALMYSSLPAMLLGYKKMPLSKKLHNKILFTDAQTQKADYMTAFAAMIGILGVGAGFWWADAAAALFISVSVIKDGYHNLVEAIKDLMDRRPVHVTDPTHDELVEKIAQEVAQWDWVKDSEVRFREHGQVYFGEIYVIPKQKEISSVAIEQGIAKVKKLHWKIYDLTVMPVSSLKAYRF